MMENVRCSPKPLIRGRMPTDDNAERLGLFMRVRDDIVDTVVFVGAYDEMRERFTPVGTGFLCAHNDRGVSWQYLVTNKHVIEQIGGDRIFVRVNKADGGSEIFWHDKSGIFCHSDNTIDLAAMICNLFKTEHRILYIPLDEAIANENTISDEEIGIGDGVVLVGLFTSHYGEVESLPVARFGNIAAVPKEKVNTQYGRVHAYLVEIHSIAGLSGSPVFAQMPALRIRPGGHSRVPKRATYFLGVLQGRFVLDEPVDSVSVSEDTPRENNSGIGVVIPAERVIELLNQDGPRVHSDETIAKDAKESGYKTSAAKPVEKSDNTGDDVLKRMLDSPPKKPV